MSATLRYKYQTLTSIMRTPHATPLATGAFSEQRTRKPGAPHQGTWPGGTTGKYCRGKAHSLQSCRQAIMYGLPRGILQRAFGAQGRLILQEAGSFTFEL